MKAAVVANENKINMPKKSARGKSSQKMSTMKPSTSKKGKVTESDADSFKSDDLDENVAIMQGPQILQENSENQSNQHLVSPEGVQLEKPISSNKKQNQIALSTRKNQILAPQFSPTFVDEDQEMVALMEVQNIMINGFPRRQDSASKSNPQQLVITQKQPLPHDLSINKVKEKVQIGAVNQQAQMEQSRNRNQLSSRKSQMSHQKTQQQSSNNNPSRQRSLENINQKHQTRAMKILRMRQQNQKESSGYNEDEKNRGQNSLTELLNFDQYSVPQSDVTTLQTAHSQRNLQSGEYKKMHSNSIINGLYQDTKITAQKILTDDDAFLIPLESLSQTPLSQINGVSVVDLQSFIKQGKKLNGQQRSRSKDKINAQLNKSGENCFKRLLDDETKRKNDKARREEQKQEDDKSQLEQFLFKPDLSLSANRRGRNRGGFQDQRQQNYTQQQRSFNDFYQDMIQYKTRVEQQKLAQQEEKELEEVIQARNAHVRLNKGSLLIVERLKEYNFDVDVHDRLYQNISLSLFNKSTRKNSKEREKSLSQHRRMTPSDQLELGQRLYSESAMRKKKKQQMREKYETMIDETHNFIKPNEYNNQVIFDKLKKDFVSYLEKDEDNKENDTQRSRNSQISLKNYIRLMHALGFIHVKSRSSTEEEMLTEIWKTLGGTNDNQVKIKNLFLVLAGIMNTQLPSLINPHSRKESEILGHQVVGNLCFDQEGDAHFISFDELNKFHLKYLVLSENRKNLRRYNSTDAYTSRNPEGQQSEKDSRSNSKQRLQRNNFTFTPKINTKSKSLAQRKFQDTLKQIHHHDLLLQKGKIISNKRSKLQDDHQKQELSKCSFYPQTNKTTVKSSLSLNKSTASIKKYLNETQQKSPIKFYKQVKTSSNLSNANFTGNIENSMNVDLQQELYKLQDGENLLEIQFNNEDIHQVDTVTRPSRKDIIELANQNLMMNKSISGQFKVQDQEGQASSPDGGQAIQNQVSFTQMSNSSILSKMQFINYKILEKTPLLYIDVNLGGASGLQRIVLYEDDLPALVAQRFAALNNLSEQKTRKLEIMINQKMQEHIKKQKSQNSISEINQSQ